MIKKVLETLVERVVEIKEGTVKVAVVDEEVKEERKDEDAEEVVDEEVEEEREDEDVEEVIDLGSRSDTKSKVET